MNTRSNFKLTKIVKRVCWNFEVLAVQKHDIVNLVDLVKSFQTSSLKYFLAKIGFDTAENEPFNFHNFRQFLAASRDLIFTERSSPYGGTNSRPIGNANHAWMNPCRISKTYCWYGIIEMIWYALNKLTICAGLCQKRSTGNIQREPVEFA